MGLYSLLKQLPIDVGQAEKKHYTAGKKIALSFIKRGSGKVAVDVGCRDGFWSEVLKSKGYKVYALDIEPHYKGAKKHDVEKGLPYKDTSVDLVWCTEVLEHLKNPEKFLKETDRVLKKNGMAILTTPNSSWWLYPFLKPWGLTPKKLQNKDHKQFFSLSSLRRIAPNYAICGYFPYALKFWKIKHAVGVLSPTFILVKT